MADDILNINGKLIRLRDNGDGTWSWATALTGSTALSKAGIGANISRGRATGTYGVNPDLVAGGTTIPASTTKTVVDISGAGVLYAIQLASTYSALSYSQYPKLTLDGTVIINNADGRISPWSLLVTSALALAAGADFGLGRVLVAASDKYAIMYDRLGVFGTSCKYELVNGHATETWTVGSTIWYGVLASDKITLVGDAYDSAIVRGLLAQGGPEDDYCVVAYHSEDGSRWCYDIFWRSGATQESIVALLGKELGLVLP